MYAALSALFAGMTAIFAKIGVTHINSDLAMFLRTVVILGVSALLVSARGEWQNPAQLSLKGAIYIGLSGMATGLSWICYFRALQTGPASRVAPIDKLSVVFVLMFAALVLGERLTWKVGVGALLIAAGAALVAI